MSGMEQQKGNEKLLVGESIALEYEKSDGIQQCDMEIATLTSANYQSLGIGGMKPTPSQPVQRQSLPNTGNFLIENITSKEQSLLGPELGVGLLSESPQFNNVSITEAPQVDLLQKPLHAGMITLETKRTGKIAPITRYPLFSERHCRYFPPDANWRMLENPEKDDTAQKRELRLMKNRDAAKECRKRKKEYVKCLETRVNVLEFQNKQLIEELRTLKELYVQRKH